MRLPAPAGCYSPWRLRAAIAQAPALAPLRGFPPDQWKAQHDREEQAQAQSLNGAAPHLHGADGVQAPSGRFARIEGRRRLLAAQLKDWGLDIHIENFRR